MFFTAVTRASGTLFSGQPHRHVTQDRLYSRFEKLLKNTDSYPITRSIARSPRHARSAQTFVAVRSDRT